MSEYWRVLDAKNEEVASAKERAKAEEMAETLNRGKLRWEIGKDESRGYQGDELRFTVTRAHRLPPLTIE